jgi:hypothetical protein
VAVERGRATERRVVTAPGAPATPRLVFLVGSPRSGTTWLQSLLGAHPSVVTPQETDVFTTVVAPLQAAWDRQVELASGAAGATRRAKGLPTLLRDDEFEALLASVVDRLVAAMVALDPAADVVVEKSPSHSRHVDLIARYLPDASFVHIIRDGRDVADSLRTAASGWGSHWAPRELKRAATIWLESVTSARTAAATGRYVEVRYEDLRAGDPAPLRRAYAACGISVDDDECRALLAEYSLTRMAGGEVASPIAVAGGTGNAPGGVREPSGFYGAGRVGGWSEWPASDRLLFDAVAGDLLVDLGLEADHRWAGTESARRRYARWDNAQRTAALAGRRIGYRSNLVLRRLPGPRPTTPYDPAPVDDGDGA